MTHRPAAGKDPFPRCLCAWALMTAAPSQALQDAPTTASEELPIPLGCCTRALETAAPLAGPSGHSAHRLGSTPFPPQAGVPGPCRLQLHSCVCSSQSYTKREVVV